MSTEKGAVIAINVHALVGEWIGARRMPTKVEAFECDLDRLRDTYDGEDLEFAEKCLLEIYCDLKRQYKGKLIFADMEV